MTQQHRLRLWLALALIAVLLATAALWLRGMLPGSSSHSTLPTPATSGVSPLLTPTHAPALAPLPSWATGGAVLLWVVLGIGLALGIAFIIVRRHRHDTE
jgi:hypothetical protein